MLFCLSCAENTSLNRYQQKGSVQKEGRRGGRRPVSGRVLNRRTRYPPDISPGTGVNPMGTDWHGMGLRFRFASFPLTSSRTDGSLGQVTEPGGIKNP
jgi:hypothetical protein